MGTVSKLTVTNMLSDIQKHKHRDRDELLAYYIEKRLNKQVTTYYKQLLSSSETLSHMSEKRVVKHLVK